MEKPPWIKYRQFFSLLVGLVSAASFHSPQVTSMRGRQTFLTTDGLSRSDTLDDDDDEGSEKFSLLDSSHEYYSEQKSRRQHRSLEHHQHPPIIPWHDDAWELVRPDEVPVSFPQSLVELADRCYSAIEQEWSVPAGHHDRRPVHARRAWDAGRIGLEVENVASLGTTHFRGAPHNALALRRMVLHLARRLSRGGPAPPRHVAVYLNTIQQALWASSELKVIRDSDTEWTADPKQRKESLSVNYVGAPLPERLVQAVNHAETSLRRDQINNWKKGVTDPSRGIVLVVQPTDFNREYKPPGPAIGSLEALQRLVAQCALHEVPIVLVSPRYQSQGSFRFGSKDHDVGSGSGPWLLRDFAPVYSCLHHRLPLRQPFVDERGRNAHYLGASLLQELGPGGESVWHAYICKQLQHPQNGVDYEYLTSIKGQRQPSSDVLQAVFEEFATFR